MKLKNPTQLTVSPSLLQTLDLCGGRTYIWETFRRRLKIPWLPIRPSHQLRPHWQPRQQQQRQRPQDQQTRHQRARVRIPFQGWKGWTMPSNTMFTHFARRQRALWSFDVRNVLDVSTLNALCSDMSAINIRVDLYRTLAANADRFLKELTTWKCIWEKYIKWPQRRGQIEEEVELITQELALVLDRKWEMCQLMLFPFPLNLHWLLLRSLRWRILNLWLWQPSPKNLMANANDIINSFWCNFYFPLNQFFIWSLVTFLFKENYLQWRATYLYNSKMANFCFQILDKEYISYYLFVNSELRKVL